MKNAINYFYNLYIEDIRKINKKYFFQIKNIQYLFMQCDRTTEEVKELYKLSLFLIQHKIPCHQFVFNRNNTIITNINNDQYVLLIIHDNSDRNINTDDIQKLSNISVPTSILDRTNWYQMWQSKIDYIEYQMSQFGRKHLLINDSFNYYIGLAEIAISILQYVPKESSKTISIAHRRIKYNTNIIEFYNPLNFIVDYKFRDIIEYYKSQFFNHNLSLNEVLRYLQISNLNQYELIIAFSRFIFPTYYFDLFEEIIIDNLDETVLLKILNRTNQYEGFIKDLYKKIRIYINIPEIEWLRNDVNQH